jgi:hypothetical protein
LWRDPATLQLEKRSTAQDQQEQKIAYLA